LHSRRRVFRPTRAHPILILLEHVNVVAWTIDARWRRRPHPRSDASCTGEGFASCWGVRNEEHGRPEDCPSRPAMSQPPSCRPRWSGLNVVFGVHASRVQFLPQTRASILRTISYIHHPHCGAVLVGSCAHALHQRHIRRRRNINAVLTEKHRLTLLSVSCQHSRRRGEDASTSM
jgi:hypothetical protein